MRREVRVVADSESEAVRGLGTWKVRKVKWVGVTLNFIKGMYIPVDGGTRAGGGYNGYAGSRVVWWREDEIDSVMCVVRRWSGVDVVLEWKMQEGGLCRRVKNAVAMMGRGCMWMKSSKEKAEVVGSDGGWQWPSDSAPASDLKAHYMFCM